MIAGRIIIETGHTANSKSLDVGILIYDSILILNLIHVHFNINVNDVYTIHAGILNFKRSRFMVSRK